MDVGFISSIIDELSRLTNSSEESGIKCETVFL